MRTGGRFNIFVGSGAAYRGGERRRRPKRVQEGENRKVILEDETSIFDKDRLIFFVIAIF